MSEFMGRFSQPDRPQTPESPTPQLTPQALTHVTGSDVTAVEDLAKSYRAICDQLAKVIVGQQEVVEQVLTAMFCRGHALLVGVPGLAKTMLIKTISEVLSLQFKRVQFTPDLMPSDITGTDVLEEDKTTGKRAFRFVRGPLFTNMLLADEINRTPPKTQAALLEAMQEHRVTAGENTYDLPQPFFVLATQNPIEQEGTYPLPEAQLDRFMFMTVVRYPSAAEELQIMKQSSSLQPATLSRVLDGPTIEYLQEVVRRVPAADHVYEFARSLVRATRPGEAEAPPLAGGSGAMGCRATGKYLFNTCRQGTGDSSRAHACDHAGYRAGGQAGAAPPHHHHLQCRGQRHIDRQNHRAAAQ